MSGDAIFMPSNAMMMIHNPWTLAVGNANELRKQADDLDQITKSSVQTYLNKAGDKLNEATLKELMDNETWLTAQEAVDYGLADEVMEPNKAAASISKKFAERYIHVPKQLVVSNNEHAETEDRNQQKREEIQKRARANAEALSINLQNMKEDLRDGFIRNED